MSMSGNKFLRVTFKVSNGDVFIKEMAVMENAIANDASTIVRDWKPGKSNFGEFVHFLKSKHFWNSLNHLRDVGRATPNISSETIFVIPFE